MKTNNIDIQELVRQSLVAALYVVLTWTLKEVSFSSLQLRLSEVMTLLVFYNPKHIKGLLIGCFLANIISPLGMIDMFVGTFASFLALKAMSKCKNIYIASLMPGIFSFIIAIELYLVGEIPYMAMIPVYLQILAAQIIVVSFIGIPIFKTIEKRNGFKKLVF